MYLSFMLNNILIILLLIEIYPQNYNNCRYGDGDLDKFLGNDTNRNEKCFSLSYSFGNGKCCIDKTSHKCVDTNSTIDSTATQDTTLTTTTQDTTLTTATQDTTLTTATQDTTLTTDSISENLDTTQSDDIITNKILLRNVDEEDERLDCPKINKLNPFPFSFDNPIHQFHHLNQYHLHQYQSFFAFHH